MQRLRGQLAAEHHKPWKFGEVGWLLFGFRRRPFLGEHDSLERHERELNHALMYDRPLRPLPHRHRADSNAESLSEGRLAQAETDGWLNAVFAVSKMDAWAVGRDYYKGALIEHWNGKSWTRSPIKPYGELKSVYALSARNVWAVGWYSWTDSAGSHDAALIEHWNGSGWRVIPAAHEDLNAIRPTLNAVVAIAHDNVWAAGYDETETPTIARDVANTPATIDSTLIQHWNGRRWKIVRSPNLGDEDELNGMTAINASNIWTVGEDGTNTLVQQWNGKAWSVVNSPSPSTASNYLNSVAALSTGDVWAGGSAQGGLIEHWNGAKWSVSPSASLGPTLELESLTLGPRNKAVWAVGVFRNAAAGPPGDLQAVVERRRL